MSLTKRTLHRLTARAGTGLLSIVLAGTLSASEKPPLDSQPISLAAQSTTKALLRLAELTNRQILFSIELTENLQSPAVENAETLEAALQQILADTSLTYAIGVDDVIEVRRVSRLGASPPEELVVTGSRVRRRNSSSPLMVMTLEQAKAQGINSVEDWIRSLPQNYASQTMTSAIDNSGSVGALGVATVDLRGLGRNPLWYLLTVAERQVLPLLPVRCLISIVCPSPL